MIPHNIMVLLYKEKTILVDQDTIVKIRLQEVLEGKAVLHSEKELDNYLRSRGIDIGLMDS